MSFSSLIKVFISITLLFGVFSTATANQKDVVGNTFKMLKDMSPKDEYELGINFATKFIKDKLYYSKHAKVKYLNKIVNTLVMSSTRPYIYDGYKVLLVKNKNFNAYALPGGIIVVNDSLFKYLKNEDQLAAILSHEIGHIQERHNLDSINNERMNDTMKVTAALAAKNNIDSGLGQNLAFGVFSGMANSIENGYDVEHEADADALGMSLMAKAGYDPKEFITVLKKLKKIKNSYGGSKYPKDRLSRLENLVSTLDYDSKLVSKNKNKRTKRFKSIKRVY